MDERLAELEQALARCQASVVELERVRWEYQSILEHLPLGVWLTDARGNVIYGNPAAQRIWGGARYVGREHYGDYRAWWPESGEPLGPDDWAIARALERNEPVLDQIVTIESFDGLRKTIRNSAVPIRDDAGRIVAMLVLNEDVTESLAAQEKIREQAEVLELAYDGIFTLSLEGVIEFWNRGAEAMYGWSKAEAEGRISHELLRTSFPEPLPDIERKLMEQGRWEGELVHHRKDGKHITVMSRWAVRKNRRGIPDGFLEITTDISERKVAEEQLRQTQKLESVGLLAGGVAHDFNNLLMGVIGNASLALEMLSRAHPVRGYIEDVLRSGQRAAELTRQLLAYAGKGRFQIGPVDVGALIREIGSIVRVSIPKNVHLQLDVHAGLPLVEGDPSQLQQLVMNLVINGAEAIGEGEHGTVLVTTGVQMVDEHYLKTAFAPGEMKTGKYVCIEVHDTGGGMDEATKARIFDPFFSTKMQGRGLGLAAALGIVRGHSGAMKVYSSPGKGSTFKVLLPVSRSAAEAAVAGSSYEDLSGTGLILVIDDEEMVRRTVKSVLQRYGYKVLLAEDGETGLDVFREMPDRISLVLLDLNMPGMGGEETLRQLRLVNPKVPIIMSSGYNEVHTVRRFAGKELVSFVQKPYSADQLARRVKATLAGNPPQ